MNTVVAILMGLGMLVSGFSGERAAFDSGLDGGVVVPLGQARDHSGRLVEGIKIIHRRAPARPPHAGGGGSGSKCYTHLAKGAKWKSVEPWVVNPANPSGIADETIVSVLNSGVETWEDAADGTVNGVSGKNILGSGSATSTELTADEFAPDNVNEVYFDSLESSAIGVTIIWGIFSGPISNRELVEWDQVYNSNFFWSVSGDPAAMDFANIAYHELGHSVGLGDLYQLECIAQTMYGYADLGETNKVTLESGDIAGVKNLYQ